MPKLYEKITHGDRRTVVKKFRVQELGWTIEQALATPIRQKLDSQWSHGI